MSLLSWFEGADSTDKGQALDAKLAQMEADQVAAGKISKEVYQQELANAASGMAENTDLAVSQGFDQGWAEGKQNIINTAGKVGGVFGDVIDSAGKGAGKFIWKLIPWWLWIVILAAGIFYFWPILRPLFKRAN